MSGRLLHRFIDDVEVRWCARCHQWLPLGVFGPDQHNWDALAGPCRKCDAEGSKRYHAKNKERVLAQKARYRAENPEKVRTLEAKCRVGNPERARAFQAKWRAKNPEKTHASGARRRARKLGADGYEYATSVHIQARRELYGNRCYICGAPAEAMDHVIPLVKGGSHWPANLRPICKPCNSSKGAKWPYAPALAAMFV